MKEFKSDEVNEYSRDERFKRRLEEFLKVLKRTDFSYMYSDDRRAYSEGKDSVDRAIRMRIELENDFPEYAQVLQGLYSQYSN